MTSAQLDLAIQSNPSAPPLLATVTVTFNPLLSDVSAQLRALPRSCIKVIVDNASHPRIWAEIESLSRQFQNVHLIRCDSNLGLAAAANRGVRLLSTLVNIPDFVLLLDQDSKPQPASIESLLTAFRHLQAEGYKVGCVGPLLMDSSTKLTHGFHIRTRFRWRRIY